MTHGTAKNYAHGGCRCDDCRAANTEREMKRRRALGVLPQTPARLVHGVASGYTNHGCRCEACREAQREAVREYRARRRGN